MLGEKIIEETGKVIGQRVLPGDTPRIEITFHGSGKALGAEHTDLGTYLAVTRPNGTLYGEGQGVLTTKDGQMATWKGNGVGKFNANGGVTWRGAVYYETQSSKLSRLNGVAGIFEYETDVEGNTKGTIFEWR